MVDLLTTPVATDIAYKWILVLFPTDPNSPYASAVAVFSGMLTFFGSLFLAWHVLSGIVMSAYTGKVLGQRFHQIWAPLRVVMGFGLLVPISGGFSSIHFLLRDVVGVAAVQMGNAPINAYITAITKVDYDEAGNVKDKKLTVTANRGRQIFDEVLKREICYATLEGLSNSIWKYFTNGVTGRIKQAPVNGEPAGIIPGMTANDGDYTWDYGYCGHITFRIPTSEETSNFAYNEDQMKKFAESRRSAMTKLVRTVRNSINGPKLSEYFANHDVEDMKSNELLESLRTEGVIKPGLAATKNSAMTAYDKAVSAAAAKIYAEMMAKSGTEMTDRINKFGFMAAGSFERALSKASAATISTANAAPEVAKPDISEEFSVPYLAAVNAVLGGPKLAGEADGGGAMLGTNLGDDPLDTIMAWISPSIAAMQNGLPSEDRDPMGDMIAFGHNLISIWEMAFAAMIALRELAVGLNAVGVTAQSSVAGLAGVSGFLAVPAAIFLDLVGLIQGWITPLFVIILLVGVLHAFVLPMLPMMMVFVMGVSWLIMFLEASIAAILWAFVFIRMDGDEFVDRAQAQGATLLFNLFLRPAIGMLAFVGGLILLPTLMDSLTILWNDGFYSQTNKDLTGLIQWVVGIVLYTWMQWHLSLRLFGLIPTIADRVGSWMGFNSHAYNDGQETTATVGALAASAAAMHRFAPNAVFSGGGGAARSRSNGAGDPASGAPGPGGAPRPPKKPKGSGGK